MRSNNIISSIANVITRFSAEATSMLRSVNAPQQQWHLNLCAGSCFNGHIRTDLLFTDMTTEIGGDYVPAISEPTKQPITVALTRHLFQRLS